MACCIGCPKVNVWVVLLIKKVALLDKGNLFHGTKSKLLLLLQGGEQIMLPGGHSIAPYFIQLRSRIQYVHAA